MAGPQKQVNSDKECKAEAIARRVVPSEIRDLFKKYASQLKTDPRSDGLTIAEIDRALTDPKVTGEEAALVAVLKTQYSKLTGLSFDLSSKSLFQSSIGVTDNDIEKFDTAAKKSNSDRSANEKQLIQFADIILDRATRKSSHCLYGETSQVIPKSHVANPAAPMQGTAPTCGLQAALTSFAYAKPDFLKNIVSNLPNGKFKVQFNGKSVQEVSLPTPTELIVFAGGSEHGIYPAVVEAAYRQFKDTEAKTKDTTTISTFLNGRLAIGKGIEEMTIRQAISLFTSIEP